MSTLARDLDLNLLRVFVVVADAGSVTEAASRLYLTQPAVSAALKRLASAVGDRLFAREGRGIVLTARGRRLLESARPHLEALIGAAMSPAAFDPRSSDRTVRMGISDSNETWLLPGLVRVLEREAPSMRLVVVPVQFRSVVRELASASIDFAVTVADDLPAGTRRMSLFTGGFAVLLDRRHSGVKGKLTRARYLEHHHVVVSYNGDLRGVIEDYLGVARKVRISVPSFHMIGEIVSGTSLLATVPLNVARDVVERHRGLAIVELPLTLESAAMELVWRSALDDDDSVSFVMGHVRRLASQVMAPSKKEFESKARSAGNRRRN